VIISDEADLMQALLDVRREAHKTI
jgi:hypothetical protein